MATAHGEVTVGSWYFHIDRHGTGEKTISYGDLRKELRSVCKIL